MRFDDAGEALMPLDQTHFKFVSDYLAEIIQGNAAIFAGAGLSMPAGYVDWRGLLRPLARDLDLNIDLESDLVALAQFHVTDSGGHRHKLHTALLDALGKDAKPTRNHKLIASLPIATIWTTNFDKLIEDSIRGSGKVVDVKSSVPQLATNRANRDVTIYKMHGDIDRPDQAIVTKDDYEKYGREYEPFVNALSGDLVNKTFLFMGFSFTDPNLEHVLSQIRLNFKRNLRQHYAIFRTRSRLAGESDEDYAHHLARQRHTIADLKRFNIKAVLVDEYCQITEILEALVSGYLRRTVFISASIANFDPWGPGAVSEFAQELARRLIADGTRIATGLGLGVGDAVFTGALREIMRQKIRIEDGLVLRPFPQTGDPTQLAALWQDYRQEIISHAGIALFLFGNKTGPGGFVLADGIRKEFDIAKDQDVALLPIGATGSMARELAYESIADPARLLPTLDADGRTLLASIAHPGAAAKLIDLIDPIIALIRKLQGKA